MKSLLSVFCMVALMASALACAKTPTGRPPISVQGTTSVRPDWALRGSHPDYPSASWFFASHYVDYVHAPSKSDMYTWLTPVLHRELVERLGERMPEALRDAAKLGMWVSQRLIPEDKVIYQAWSSGVAASAFLTVSKSDVANYLALRALPALPPKLGDEAATLPALEIFTFRTRRLGIALERLAMWVLSEGAVTGVEETNLEALLAEAVDAEAYLQDFRTNLRAAMTGGRRRLKLGEKPQEPITLTLTYMGNPAAYLPLDPVLENLNAQERVVDADGQTNSTGTATLSFVSGLRYVGKENIYVGFALAPDKRLPELRTGVAIVPWQTILTFPVETNVVVYVNIIEKIAGKSVSGPLGKEIETLVRGRLPVTTSLDPATIGETYVLEIGGVINVTRLRGTAGVDQMRADGAVILRHYKGPAITSISVQGFADVRGDDTERAEREALENIWSVHGEQIKSKLGDAFPPLLR